MPRSKQPCRHSLGGLELGRKRPLEDPPTDSPPKPPTLTVDVALANGTKAPESARQVVDLCDDTWMTRADALFAPGYVPKPNAGPGRGTGPRCVVPKKAKVLHVMVEARVPEGCVSVDFFHIRTAHGIVRVRVPAGSKPGDKIRVRVTPASASRCKLDRLVDARWAAAGVCVLD